MSNWSHLAISSTHQLHMWWPTFPRTGGKPQYDPLQQCYMVNQKQSWYQTKSCCSHMRNSSLPLLILTPRCSWWAASLPYTQQCRSHIHIWQSACVYGKRKLFRTEPFSLSQGYAWMFGNVHLLSLLQLALPKAYSFDTCEPHSQTPLIAFCTQDLRICNRH